MKLFALFIYAFCLAVSVNASADEAKDQTSTAQVQQANMQVADTKKVSTNQAVDDEASHQHDALRTQFLGKRPYMEIKAK
ncbi:hypothetical protein C3Y98_03025 [Methylotenera oryzisoli]|uniref:Uncharacterized protein n=1 Tax=Methylotenera oryzisoli TaxID=2080758 RepID=A0A4Y9VU40_9PROT|nr:hypothetical protein [Methylotenera oryzisoli]TFW72593.1 hypothetical protein C3Y98_03025 [Methylotenera oryzisoli]